MKIKKTSLSCLIASALCSGLGLAHDSTSNQHAGQPSHLTQQSCMKATQKTISMPITRASSGHVLINGLLNSVEQQMVVDTGGIGVGGVLSNKVLKQINQQRQSNDEVKVQGANHSKSMQLVNIDSAGASGALVNKMNFVVSTGEILPETDIQILIGSRYLCNFLVEFNLQDNQMTFYPRDYSIKQVIADKQDSWSRSHFEDVIESGAIVFDMQINDVPVKALLDTGARHSIMNWQAAAKLGLSKSSEEINVEENLGSGLHGNAPKNAYTFKLASLSFAQQSVQQKNMKMHINDMEAFKPIFGDSAAVNLGIDFFNGRILLIDYANKEIAISR